MRPTFPFSLAMNANVLEQKLAQLFSQCCIGFTKKSFATRALKPDRNRLILPTNDIQAPLYAALFDDDHGRRSGLCFGKLENVRIIRCLKDAIYSILLHQRG
ncbi:hypothetical protein SAMN03159307_05530 [Pseudomonas sp. NFACC46-3]|nr:hypothetical protein SAMN03159307_05530 [Pseudomonas sp. NFACC46-3]